MESWDEILKCECMTTEMKVKLRYKPSMKRPFLFSVVYKKPSLDKITGVNVKEIIRGESSIKL